MTGTATFVGQTLAALKQTNSAYSRPAPPAGGPDLQVGEVRYDLPDSLRAELGECVARLKQVGYSDPHGERDLRSAYSRHLREAVPGRIPGGEVVVTTGGKEAVWLALGIAAHMGQVECALLPQPGWEPYSLWLTALGCRWIGYDPAAVAENPAIVARLVENAPERPTLLLLNYPHNPTGIGVDQAAMDALVEVAAGCGLRIVSDEVYRAFGDHPASACLAPAFDPDRDLVADSCSKWLGAAGLRVGFLQSGAALLDIASQVRATYASCTSLVTQRLATVLLTSPEAAAWQGAVHRDIAASRSTVAAELAKRGLVVESLGGLYVWVRRPLDGDRLMVDRRIAPAGFTDGAGFGAPDRVRLCIAREGLDPADAADAVVAALEADR